jgi:hypothetical protein
VDNELLDGSVSSSSPAAMQVDTMSLAAEYVPAH